MAVKLRAPGFYRAGLWMVFGLAFSPNGKRAAIGCDDGAAYVWQLP